MKYLRTLPGCLLCLFLCLCGCVSAVCAETNYWPVYTWRGADAEARPETTTALAPFYERKEFASPSNYESILSIRPLFTSIRKPWPKTSHWHVLYPLFNYYEHDEDDHWNLLFLLRGSSRDQKETTKLEIWPFWFSRDTGDPETSYQALFPLAGELQDMVWRDRVEFFIWPLYAQTEKNGEVRTHTPYPFIQHRSGTSSGWGFWPFYGHFERPDDYSHTWAAWPFYYRFYDDLEKTTPRYRFGVLPFYTVERYEGYEMKNYVWPFFGYTRQSDPLPDYRETRYLWPFIVQGRGEERYINRVFPFYSIDHRPGYKKRWTLWPVWRDEERIIGPESQIDTQTLLFFIYFNEVQSAPEFRARKNFLWPLFGYWNNGDDRRQFQLFDPLSPIFKYNETIRETWTPFFAIYRYDARPDSTRHSALWNFLVVESDRNDDTGAFYLGPLYESVDTGEAAHWSVLHGLLGRSRDADGNRHWQVLWMNFGR